jgi:hypothetical protein
MMKKIMCALILVITTGTVFAQLALDGYINSGLGLVITDRQVDNGEGGTKNADPYVVAFGVDSWQWAYRFRFNGSYTNEAKTAGAKFRFQSQGISTSTTPIISTPIALGWVSFLDVFTLSAGYHDDATWNSGDVILDDDQGEGLGMLLKATPTTGLDLGVAAWIDQSAVGPGKSNANVWYNNKYTFNAAYTNPDLFKVVATFRTQSKASMRAIGAFHLRAVQNLTAIVAGEFDNLHDFDKTGKVNIFETLGYKISDFGFGVDAVEYISQAENSDIGIRVNPWLSYALGNIVPRLDFVYFMGGQVVDSDNEKDGRYYRRGYAALYDSSTAISGDNSVITIRPSVKFNIGSTFVEVGDAINIEARKDPTFGVATVADGLKKDKITNIFYIDVKASF